MFTPILAATLLGGLLKKALWLGMFIAFISAICGGGGTGGAVTSGCIKGIFR